VAAGLTLPEYLNVLFSPSGPRATVASIDGELYSVAPGGLTLLTTGAPIGENEQVRTAKGSRAVLRLRDGSLVEVAERSDLRVSERFYGKTVALERGSVMVEAAKQRRGRLEISTPDCLVSVKGTIFGVSKGLKGSRVSVVEGEVRVDKASGMLLLHRGDQTATNPTMAPTSVAQDISWSANSAKYDALLGELAVVAKKLEEIPGPEMRYRSKLTSILPANTAVFIGMPNLSATLAEANSIIEDRAKQSPVVREWWNAEGAKNVRWMVAQVKTVSDYLGDEVVLAVTVDGGKLGEPMVVAEEKKPGLKEYLAQSANAVKVVAEGGVVTINGRSAQNRGFESTDFGKRIAESYASGAGWLFAVDLEQMKRSAVRDSIGNMQYLIGERRQNLGRIENSVTVSFEGERSGVANWIAAPAPMGTLDFISPDATFAASFVVNKPGVLFEQLPMLAQIHEATGVNVAEDIAATLGGEVTVAVDGPLLPSPSWKIAAEVNDPSRLEWSVEQMVKTAPPDQNVKLTHELVGGMTYYTLSSANMPFDVNYTFTDGYLLMAPNQNLLTASIEGRTKGQTLSTSTTFREQLPQNGQMNFSALAYYSPSAAIAPMADQLTQTKFLTEEQKKALAALTTDRKPTLIYAYAEPDRIVAATRGSFLGLGLDALLGLSEGHAGDLMSELMKPALGVGGH